MKSALVIISHYNAWPTDDLVVLLDQIREIPAGHPFRCLVVVNQAVDRPLELPAAHQGVEILYRENSGYNIGAWNHGWKVAPPADYYLFLQEECRILRPDWLGAMLRPLANPKIGLVGESMAWPGITWKRVRAFNVDRDYEGLPGQPPINFVDGVKRFFDAKGLPMGRTGEHLQALILATRRDVLEAIDGFLIGSSKGDAISCEIAISRSVAANGWKIKRMGLLPFRYILHPQWAHFNRGIYSLMLEWVNHSAPLPIVQPLRHFIFNLYQSRTGKPFNWESPKLDQAGQPTTTQRAGSNPS